MYNTLNTTKYAVISCRYTSIKLAVDTIFPELNIKMAHPLFSSSPYSSHISALYDSHNLDYKQKTILSIYPLVAFKLLQAPNAFFFDSSNAINKLFPIAKQCYRELVAANGYNLLPAILPNIAKYKVTTENNRDYIALCAYFQNIINAIRDKITEVQNPHSLLYARRKKRQLELDWEQELAATLSTIEDPTPKNINKSTASWVVSSIIHHYEDNKELELYKIRFSRINPRQSMSDIIYSTLRKKAADISSEALNLVFDMAVESLPHDSLNLESTKHVLSILELKIKNKKNDAKLFSITPATETEEDKNLPLWEVVTEEEQETKTINNMRRVSSDTDATAINELLQEWIKEQETYPTAIQRLRQKRVITASLMEYK